MDLITKRLESFKTGWPHRSISPETLAQAGFYFTKVHDKIRCSFCDFEIEHLDHKNICQEHRKRSPNCPIVQRFNKKSSDTCGIYGIGPLLDYTPQSEPWRGRKKHRPEYPEYALVERRVASFAEWPKSMKQKVEDLAGAGLFYTGKGDRTMCFHCGLGLNKWEEDDVPWKEHAKWSQDCEYLILLKGKDTVEAIAAKKDGVNVSEEQVDGRKGRECSKKGSECVNNSKVNCTNGHKEESIELKDSIMCKICFGCPVSVAFEPCGHTTCFNCSFSLKHCHICRGPIKKRIKLYL